MPSRIDDIQQVTTAIAGGSKRAFAAWYGPWYDWSIQETARLTGRDLSFCHDVVQDVMLSVIRAMPPMPDEARQRGWLRRTLINRARDHLRRDLRRLRRERDRGGPARSADTVAAHRRDLHQALRRLDEASSTLLRWRFDLGWTLARIGRELGLSTSAADGRVRSAVTKLQKNLETDGGGV
jgi:RNA polymerase sigma factor (sigma-70 family)